MTDPRYEVLRAAMYKIAWPMKALREYAEDIGHDFEPVMGRQLANSAEYLKGVAREAMAEIATIDPAGVNDRPAPAPSSAQRSGE